VTVDPFTLSDASKGLSSFAVTGPVAFETLTTAVFDGTPIVTLLGDAESGCAGDGVVVTPPEAPPLQAAHNSKVAQRSGFGTVMAPLTLR
jgi:hypothetical protein